MVRDRFRELIRSVDWSATPLGSVGSWSPVLRGALASSFPMVIHWGEQRVATSLRGMTALSNVIRRSPSIEVTLIPLKVPGR
jgi:hypothetical protein